MNQRQQQQQQQVSQSVSLYIPYVFSNVSEAFIRDYFKNAKIGDVNNVVFKHLTHEIPEKIGAKKAFVYFDKWFNTEEALCFQTALYYGNGARVYYNLAQNLKNFWVVLFNCF